MIPASKQMWQVAPCVTVGPVTDPDVAIADLVAAAVEAADLRPLVLALFHHTGDERWLQEPYVPRRDVRLIADPAAGFPPEVQEEIKAEARRVFADGTASVVVDDPGRDRFHEMMNIFLGEAVPDEYVQLMREDMGFESGDAQWSAAEPADADKPDVVIVGTGVFGVCLATKLDRLGIPFTMLERNDEVGGTWLNNRYPGCGVDTPNHFYSYSFAPNPAWRHFFSPRDELQAYVEQCATDFGIRDRIRFGRRLTSARWDEAGGRWRLSAEVSDGSTEELHARVLVAATGHFDQPVNVAFAGLDDFGGQVHHTAQWPADVDLADKRVGVIGTGASSMQVVPTIAGEVESLTVFQRTAQWARPVAEYNLPVDPAGQWLFEHVPHYAKWYRFGLFWRYGDGLLRFLRKDPEWPHPQRSLNRTNDRHRQEMTEFIESSLASKPELIPHCLPDYPPFGKRILIDNGWFETLCEPHVDLVTASIDRFEQGGVRTADGRLHELDVVVMATGFDVTNFAARIDVTGRDGVRLADDWADDDPTAYLGMTVPGFPNFFVMYGPNTNVGHGGSGMWLAENQARYVSSAVVAMTEAGATSIDVRPELRDDYTAEIDRLHEDLVWTHPGVSTYYRTVNGKVRSPMPFRLVDYWARTHDADLDDYVVT